MTISDSVYSTEPVYIATKEDLKLFRQTSSTVRRRVICIILPDMDEMHRRSIERRIERALSACGCNEGTIAGLLYLIVTLLMAFYGQLKSYTLFEWGTIVAGFFAFLLLGKLFGLAIARIRLQRALTEIERAFEQQQRAN